MFFLIVFFGVSLVYACDSSWLACFFMVIYKVSMPSKKKKKKKHWVTIKE
ncbi:hypothetical protein HanIR_Chr15g0730691 [Helianthus annuus]|nr:hypothetical protein HanIR_Chr15g0730691 [Helianthus annuus]